MRSVIANLLFLIGITLMVFGAWSASEPLGLITAGIGVAFLGVLLVRLGDRT